VWITSLKRRNIKMANKFRWEIWWKDAGTITAPLKARYKYPHTALKAAKDYLRDLYEDSDSSINISVKIYNQDNRLISSWDIDDKLLLW